MNEKNRLIKMNKISTAEIEFKYYLSYLIADWDDLYLEIVYKYKSTDLQWLEYLKRALFRPLDVNPNENHFALIPSFEG